MGFVLPTVLAVSGCSVFDPTLLGDEVVTDGRPPRPEIPDNGTDAMSVAFRIEDVLLNSTVDWPSIGRNMDLLVTTRDTPENRECDPPSGGSPPTDGPGGIDNAMGAQLLSVVELIIPCLEGELANSHIRGEGTLMIWMQGWNGMANDSSVEVSMLVAADGTTEAPANVQWDAATEQLVLASDGTTPAPDATGAVDDFYIIRPDSFSGGGNPIPVLRDVNGYVSNGSIVFEMPDNGDLPLNAGIGSLTIKATDVLMVANMNAELTAVESGAISGRFGLVPLLDAGVSIGVCPGSTQDTVEQEFQELLDVKQNGEPGGECDAMSFGIPFTATPITLQFDGELPYRATSNPTLPDACDRQPTDPPLCPN